MRMYPIFTDGKKFYHQEELAPRKCRTSYFSKYNLKEWRIKEKPDLTEEKAKSIWQRWENNKRKMEEDL